MQGRDKREAEHQPHTRLENPEEPSLPTLTLEKEIDMQEGSKGVKRGQSECQRQIEKKRRNKAWFTRHYAGEL